MNLSGASTLMGLPRGRFDSHCHVFRADIPMVKERRYTPGYDALPESLCHLLMQHKYDGALLIQPSFLGCDNSYLLDTLSNYTNHEALCFKGVVVLDPAAKPSARQFAEMEASGVVGIRLNLYRRTGIFDYASWKSLLADVEDRGWHIELHCEAARLSQVLPTLVRNHSSVVIDHFGLVSDARNCDGLKTILDQPPERLWIKSSAAYRLGVSDSRRKLTDHIDQLKCQYIAHLGADKIIWGSDWPFTQFENTVTYESTMRACDR